jgi:hypothetical protein
LPGNKPYVLVSIANIDSDGDVLSMQRCAAVDIEDEVASE